MYNCAVGIPSKTDERRLAALRSWYQIPDKLNPRLAVCGEWCCNPRFGIGVYEAYLLGGLKLPLNAFAREFLLGQVQGCVNLTLMHGHWLSLCKFCGGKCLKGIVLLLWTSSSIATNPLRLTNPSHLKQKLEDRVLLRLWFLGWTPR